MKRPVRNASQTSIIKIRELHSIPLKTFNFNWIKTIVLAIMILGAVIITSAQEPKTGNNFLQKKFNKELITDSAEYFVISPKLKTDPSEIEKLPFQKLPDDSFKQNNQGKNDFFANSPKSEYSMPVAGAGGRNYFNMPVAVPDSTVHYYIKDKRVDYVNPLERNNK
ncbi:hypothetical protein MASR2M47_08160 [Draconibacterium sp.]|jgi:hypothetical protein